MGRLATALRLAGAAAILAVGLMASGDAKAQVTTRELLSWCEGALGGSVTAEFDAFQCTTYLRAMLDLKTAEGVDLSGCFGGQRTAAADLMARLVPDLRARAAVDADVLAEPANEAVLTWIAATCPEGGLDPSDGGAQQRAAGTDIDPPSPAAPSDDGGGVQAPTSVNPFALDARALELEVWRSTQRIEAADQRRDALTHYLDRYPDGTFARVARLQLEEMDAVSALSEPSGQQGAGPGDPAPAGTRGGDPSPLDPVAIMDRDQRRDVQRSLQQLGHYRLRIDGVFGPGTRSAVRAFQRDLDRPQTGRLTEAEVDRLFEMAPVAPPQALTAPGIGAERPGSEATAFSSPHGRPPAVQSAVPSLFAPIPAIVVRNLGNSAVVEAFAIPPGEGGWGPNRLNGRVLLPGAETLVPLFDHPGRCLFNMRLVDENRFERHFPNVDVCRVQFVGFR